MARSSAEERAEALADIKRIAMELAEAEHRIGLGTSAPWGDLAPAVQLCYLQVVEELLQRDVIRVGKRPPVETKIPGQTTIDEAT